MKNSLSDSFPVESSATKTLYHYTSVGAFLSICDNRTLRASDLKVLNDPREVSLGSDLLENYIAELGYPKPGLEQEHLVELRKKYTELKDNFALFGVSLSRSRDSLPQWLEYGDRGRGICLGFREFPFDSKLNGYLRASEVAYSQSQFLSTIQETFIESEGLWRKNSKKWKEEEKEQHLFSASLSLLSNCASYKHHTWEHEQEVRYTAISYRFGSGRSTQYSFPSAIEEILNGDWPRFRERGGHIIPYVDLPLGDPIDPETKGKGSEDTIFVLDEVIVGPICRADLDVVGAVLNRTNKDLYCPTIGRSDCDIRP